MTAPVVQNPILAPADVLPWLDVQISGEGRVNIDKFGGLRTCFVFLPKLTDPRCRAIFEHLVHFRRALSQTSVAQNFAMVPVLLDGTDIHLDFVKPILTEQQIAVDGDRHFATACGALKGNAASIMAIVSDERLIVRQVIHYHEEKSFMAALYAASAADAASYSPSINRAPVMVLQNILSAEECKSYIDYWQASQPKESGYMKQDETGKGYMVLDHSRKSRRDVIIEKQTPAFDAIWTRFQKRVHVHLARYYHAHIVDVERFALARYASAEGGKFRKHRDFDTHNDHREFAVTINLNDSFSGGELELPEFPGEKFKPKAGDAVVYAGTLMHEVTPVTSGDRYCLLAFLMTARGKAALDDYINKYGRDYEVKRKESVAAE